MRLDTSAVVGPATESCLTLQAGDDFLSVGTGRFHNSTSAYAYGLVRQSVTSVAAVGGAKPTEAVVRDGTYMVVYDSSIGAQRPQARAGSHTVGGCSLATTSHDPC